MILFHLQTLGAGRHIPIFLNFCIIKFWKRFKKTIFENVRFFFLLERDLKRKNYECDGLGTLANPIPYKMMLVSAS